MKKLVVVVIAIIGLQAIAQQEKKQNLNQGNRNEKMMNLSAEEIATLQTKKMTLHLDLNASQQAEIQKINLENAKKRKAIIEKRKAIIESGEAEKPTDEERYKMQNAKLDHMIAIKVKMKDILNADQYTKWEKAQMRRGMQGKKGMKKRIQKDKK